MARKVKISDAQPEQFGILISYGNGPPGWLVGNDNDYMLFATDKDAAKALRQLKKNENYSWNCTAEVAKFQ